MIDYKNYKESKLKRIGREVFFWFVGLLGALVVSFSIYATWALLYVLSPEIAA